LIHLLRKYYTAFLGLFFVLSFSFYFWFLQHETHDKDIAKLQYEFTNLEKKLDVFLKNKREQFLSSGIQSICKYEENTIFYFHVYRNDSLIYWNSNQLPVSRFSDIHYPAEGIVHLQNGWYYAAYERIGEVVLASSFLIKKEYQYENESLINKFSPHLIQNLEGNIILDHNEKNAIYTKNNDFLFSIDIQNNTKISSWEGDLLFVLLLISILTILILLFQKSNQFSHKLFWVVPVGILAIRYLSLKFQWLVFIYNTTVFQPNTYADSTWNPNFGEYIINCVLILFMSLWIQRGINELLRNKANKLVTLLLYGLSFYASLFIANLYIGLVENSSIPLQIDQLFTLNFYSILAISSMGILFYSYFLIVKSLYLKMLELSWKSSQLILLWFFSSCFYFLFSILYGKQLLFLAIWPLLINGFILLNAIRSQGVYKFSYGILLLFLFSVYISVTLKEINDLKEYSERELFANQLASDQDIETEIEYTKIKSSIQTDQVLQKISGEKREMSVSSFKEMMERKFFNHFWERYEIEFYLFSKDEKPIIHYSNIPDNRKQKFDAIIENHSEISEIDSSVFYINDFTSNYSYIIREKILEDNLEKATLYCILKSKKIPEKIGFPRLLISSKAKVFKSLENYSIAKYYKGKLVSNNGKFSYPTSDLALTKNAENASGYYVSEGYNHLLYRKNKRDLIVLSRKNQSIIQLVTTFSYLFSFYGVFLLVPFVFANSKRKNQWTGLSLAIRIQLVFIALVFVSLVAFGFGSGIFVKNQYQEYTTQLIREKMRSVEIEIMQKLGDEKNLSIVEHGNFMEYILKKFATVFVTDINLYDKNGYMLSSSRPKIYNIGLVGEQINSKAWNELTVNKKSEYIHQESIGKLEYLSAYLPFYSQEGKLLAYLNLQHFGQQKGFEDQIQQFLVAIMNVFVLLLALSILSAIFISNWLTALLRVLQQNFSKIELGKYNKPISYSADDEIGTLVKEYNQKLEELAFTAQQLAQSERESAWREMAKQVAHEIKNPLTPMKLGLQHLQRVFDPKDPNAADKIAKVTASMIEQIDALTNIANEFSNFAKMPLPKNEVIEINKLIENVITVFEKESDVLFEFINSNQPIYLTGDRDMILRVFNNIIKNAIQAIPSDQKGKISVELKTNDSKKCLISISDNGKGISEEIQSKLFIPYFTTKSTGTGLGLAMVKQIIELHHGSITFTSTENVGTLFKIELPII
jgi:two-component system nitrogen regulation sensor histidine kinase NtrY